MNVFLDTINKGRSTPGGAAQSIQVRSIREGITQNISFIFYAFHLMKSAKICPQSADYNFISSLMSEFEYCSQNHPGDRMSQDICFVIQGITSIVEQGLLPKGTNLSMLFNTLPEILLRTPHQTTKLVDHITKSIVCLGVLSDIHTISRPDFTTLLALMSRCLKLMSNQNIDTSNERSLMLKSAIKLSAKAGLQNDENLRLADLSTNVNKLDLATFISRLDRVLIPAELPSALHQSATFFRGPLMVTFPQASQGEFTTLENWLGLVELESNLLHPLQSPDAAFTKSTIVNTLLEQAFTFFMQNLENWESQPNPLKKARILIYGLGLLAGYADRIQYQITSKKAQYNLGLNSLFIKLINSICSYNLESSCIKAFIEDAQFAFLGLKFILHSERLFSDDIRMINFAKIDFAISANKLVGCLKTNQEQSRSQLPRVLSVIQSLGAIVERRALSIDNAANAFQVTPLIDLMLELSKSEEVPLIELKGVINAFRFLFRLNSLQDPAVKRNIILKTLLIPFERTSNQQVVYIHGVLAKFCPVIVVGLSLIDQTDDVKAILVFCNLMGLMHPSAAVNIAQSVIDSTYQQIHQLLKKQLNVGYQPDHPLTSRATIETELGAQASAPRDLLNLERIVRSFPNQDSAHVVDPFAPLYRSEEICFDSDSDEEDNVTANTGSSTGLEPENDAPVPFSQNRQEPWFYRMVQNH